MTFHVNKGRHRFLPLYWLRWWPLIWNASWIKRRVMFTFESKYVFEGEAAADQPDHNKLFGAVFGWRIHRCSARFGWRYDPPSNNFILSAYCYLNGARVMEDLCSCVVNHWYECHLFITSNTYIFRVVNENGELITTQHISKGHNNKLSLLLGPFFGGNETPGKSLSLQLKKF
jgi:hypothetical protein